MNYLAARHVALYLIWAAVERGKPITNLELLKLLFYAQGWFLALYDRPLFREKIRAWKQGPVISSIYGEFKHNGRHPIITIGESPNIAGPIKRHLDYVLEVLGDCGAFFLKRMTHSEDPWKNARAEYAPDDPSNVEIPVEEMKIYFTELIHGRRRDEEYEWVREALSHRAKEEENRFQDSLSWVNENYGEALQRLAE